MWRYNVTILMLVCLCGFAKAGDADKAASPEPPKVLDQFPGRDGKVVSHFDGSMVCRTDAGMFMSDGNPLRWSAVPGPSSSGFCQPLGGDRTRFFVSGNIMFFGEREAKAGDVNQAIAAINIGGKLDVVWRGTPGILCLAAFATKDIGAVAWSRGVNGADGSLTGVKNNFLLTLDGGKTWKATQIPDFEAKFYELPDMGSNQALKMRVFEGIANLLWLDSSRLLVASSEGSLQLVERKDNGTLHRLWVANVGGGGKDLFLDGDHVWAGYGPIARRGTKGWQPGKCSISRLTLANGKVDGTITADSRDRESGEDDGAAVCHQCFLTWGFDRQPISFYNRNDGVKFEDFEARLKKAISEKHIDVWASDPKQGYIRRARIVAPSVAGVLPLKSPLCLVITRDGKGLQLDLEKCKLSPATLQVTLRPRSEAEIAKEREENAKQAKWLQMTHWFEKISNKGERVKIMNSVFGREDLTRDEQVELATKRLREYVNAKKAKEEESPKEKDSTHKATKQPSGE